MRDAILQPCDSAVCCPDGVMFDESDRFGRRAGDHRVARQQRYGRKDPGGERFLFHTREFVSRMLGEVSGGEKRRLPAPARDLYKLAKLHLCRPASVLLSVM
jgi:hypothetical protein